MARQQHLDRLSAVDASFLSQEKHGSHMHIGALVIFEGPAPPIEDFRDHISSRLGLVPRYRQKLHTPPLETGRPLWIDDPAFNLEYHVRHSALPSPGSEEQLLLTAGLIFSQRLDRSKPLWEMWLVEGLERDRFALISKTHHALIDGISGVDLATVLFDLERRPSRSLPAAPAWEPHAEPSAAQLAAAGARDLARLGVDVTSSVAGALTSPGETLERVRDAAEGLGEIAWNFANPAPTTPFNQPIGPHRRYAIVRNRLADFKLIKDTFGASVNDVVLAVVAGGLRDFLHERRMSVNGLELRALVPLSLRSAGDQGTLGNRLALLRAPLPVYIADPVARLRRVMSEMGDLKRSKQAVGAQALTRAENFAPPTILAQASRLNFSTRLFNLIVTNVPGPQFPLYVMGCELEALFPIAFLPDQHTLAIAIMSYNGAVNFGLLGDWDALPDLDRIAEGVEASVDELLAAARRHRAGSPASTGAPA